MSSSDDIFSSADLPAQILFGTSTWTYPGWKGQIYNRTCKSEKDFKANCLSEYASNGLFRIVGIDSSFYSPPSKKLLENYAAQLPPGFLWVSKVWEHLTIPRFPKHARYGKYRGLDNPDFLNPKLFIERVLTAYKSAEIYSHTGPFVFQFPTISKSVMERQLFFERLAGFLSDLPKEFRYAVELRNPDFLCEEYFQLLNMVSVAHCFNHWGYMPALKKQMELAASAGGLKADFYIARILTPLGLNYEKAVKRFQPYDALKEPIPEMRADVVRLAKRALERKVSALVLVNNRAEGNAPLTIKAISDMLRSEL